MSLRAEVNILKKAIKPKATIRFTMNEDEINESIPGVIWVFFAIKESAQDIANILSPH